MLFILTLLFSLRQVIDDNAKNTGSGSYQSALAQEASDRQIHRQKIKSLLYYLNLQNLVGGCGLTMKMLNYCGHIKNLDLDGL